MGGGDYGPHERLTLRRATLGDLDDVLTVALEGLSGDPKFDYRFPYREEYPEDHRKWLRQEYKEFLEQPEKYALMIMTASDNDDKPVSFAIWDIAIAEPHMGSDLGVPDNPNGKVIRRDVNPTRYRQWKKQIVAGFEEYLGKYGTEQLHLWVLCTLPAFRGRGAATGLCRWGLERASRQGFVSTVLSTDANGKKLYEKLGFDLCGSFTIRVEGEEESMDVWPMAHSS
ncbi:hypothetical protein DL771_003288 [Monosporascus sp. 5C6A]|nr:hypothetical protein DL771_003288 [Monosporascus sp. 5C6A]